ncbi:hypothetical protein FYK55_16970 [Roseiconus nitratireducens]|uniref:Uncharacterized protein n=1 Tax=Roseiconus nitratireducens TaxID=2605748 RepID=A0A5M6D7P5_9BACT|nr:hypothetical protein [Roseiconus nitratireducens]KAA5541889.1 hypothetical protein FYK55_16970 [Roseiconus nitratireducens]
MTTTNHKVAFGAKAKSGRSGNEESPARLPRVTKLMALAIRLDQLIRNGVVADQAEIARLGYVSRARLTQIMDLLLLAPDIQEEILRLPPVKRGESCISEHDIRPIAATACWDAQRQMWRAL